MQFVVMFGDLSSGFEFIGPFEQEEAAYDYGGEYCTAAAWFVVMMWAPNVDGQDDNEDLVVMHGDPVKGFNFAGPFPSVESAEDYAQEHTRGTGGTWFVETLAAPNAEFVSDCG